MSTSSGLASEACPRLLDFDHGAIALAHRLLGQRLVRIDDHGRRCAGEIVETEAYVGPEDLAAHSSGGRRTARNASMYLPAGHAYVYFVHGMHWCFNVVARGARGAEAVLIRALRPVDGVELMAARRGREDLRTLCAGPARLTRALGLCGSFDGVDLRVHRGIFLEEARVAPLRSIAATRIGVEYAGPWARRPWRFLLAGAEPWWSRGPGRRTPT